jgi:hypothetical protein
MTKDKDKVAAYNRQYWHERKPDIVAKRRLARLLLSEQQKQERRAKARVYKQKQRLKIAELMQLANTLADTVDSQSSRRSESTEDYRHDFAP